MQKTSPPTRKSGLIVSRRSPTLFVHTGTGTIRVWNVSQRRPVDSIPAASTGFKHLLFLSEGVGGVCGGGGGGGGGGQQERRNRQPALSPPAGETSPRALSLGQSPPHDLRHKPDELLFVARRVLRGAISVAENRRRVLRGSIINTKQPHIHTPLPPSAVDCGLWGSVRARIVVSQASARCVFL